MAGEMRMRGGRRVTPWRLAGWGGVTVVLLLPLVLGAPWTLFDYVFAGVILGGAGLVLEGVVRASDNLAYRVGALIAVAASVLLVWVNGAVGFLGDEDNPANLIFFGVIAIATLGSLLAGFRAGGMARAMFAAAAAQMLIGTLALPVGWASPGMDGVREVVMGTTVFTVLWLVSGGLFRRASNPSQPPV